jgi:hypothetical protein
MDDDSRIFLIPHVLKDKRFVIDYRRYLNTGVYWHFGKICIKRKIKDMMVIVGYMHPAMDAINQYW